jgi:phosphoribosylamine--glycine ligase
MLLDKTFGEGRVVVEDFLTGPEFSFLCFVDGNRVYPMPLSQDHKRAFDGDKGPNTGGMGAYTGLPFITPEDREFAYREILCKAAGAMVSEGLPLSGVLYGGLMKTPQGIKVIEFNARFGDPETEVVLPLLQSDIYDIFEGVATGTPVQEPVWADGVTLGVVLASKGYPGHYEKGFDIKGLDQVEAKVYHMGTGIRDGKVFTNGGRVLMVVSGGTDLADARARVYEEVRKIHCDNLFYRNDIAHIAFE